MISSVSSIRSIIPGTRSLMAGLVLAVGLSVAIVACDSGSDMEEEPGVAETFTVTVEEIGSSYQYSEQNQVGVAYAIDGEVGRELTLERGETYEFVLESSVQEGPEGFPHPFYIDRSPEGQGTSPFGDGVENAESVSGTVTFSVPESAPDELFYECLNHVYMGGQITIEDGS